MPIIFSLIIEKILTNNSLVNHEKLLTNKNLFNYRKQLINDNLVNYRRQLTNSKNIFCEKVIGRNWLISLKHMRRNNKTKEEISSNIQDICFSFTQTLIITIWQ